MVICILLSITNKGEGGLQGLISIYGADDELTFCNYGFGFKELREHY